MNRKARRAAARKSSPGKAALHLDGVQPNNKVEAPGEFAALVAKATQEMLAVT